MKIVAIDLDNRKRQFEVRARGGRVFKFPYAKAMPTPTAQDRIVEAFVDPELGREAFTYRLSSGREGSVPMDAVLEYNEDPSHMAELALYRLTLEAQARLEKSGMSVRQVARSLGTSPAQLYRLLDPTNSTKSLKQMVALLHILGAEVSLEVKTRSRRAS